MISWIPYVFVRVVIFFAAGILLGIYYPDFIPEKAVIAISVVVLLLYIFLLIFYFTTARFIANPGFVGLATIFLCGYLCLLQNTTARDEDHFMHVGDSIKYYQVVVTQRPQEKEKTWKIEAQVLTIFAGAWQTQTGNVLLYLSKSDFGVPFAYGDVLLIRGAPKRVEPPGNPGEFDYRRFLEFRNIYHQQFLRKGQVEYLLNDPPYRFIQLAINARIWSDATLRKNVHGEREQATASALVLGVTDGLDDELLIAYAATGAMHVLAVSGLHISIIYLIIAFMLKPLSKLKHGKLILAIVGIILLWAYSFVTGLSPSVLRAVVMFSFMAVARGSNRQTNIYNTLAAAAFCLLVYDPQMIMSVGFQLSFLAVFGIVYLHPFIYLLWAPKSWIMIETWKMTSVSIAAQLATFPLGLLYFHQFPNYFLLSNLFVIPGSFVVLLSGMALLAFSFLEPLAYITGFILEWTIRFLNGVVFVVESIPLSLIDNIHISPIQCWLLMAITAMCTLLIVQRNLFFLQAAVALSIAFAVVQWNHYIEQVDTSRFTVYEISGHSAMELSFNGHAFLYADSAILCDSKKKRFHIQPNRLLHGVEDVEERNLVSMESQGAGLIRWHGKHILRIRNDRIKWPQSEIDFIIISHNGLRNLDRIPADFRKARVILDSSNSYYFAVKMIRQAAVLKMNVHSVPHSGAFDLDIKINDHEIHRL